VTWPADELGCYEIPVNFPLGRFSYEEWQVYWGIPHQIVERAMAMRAAQHSAAHQRGARYVPVDDSTWSCENCGATVVAAFSHCGFCGTSRVASAPTQVLGGGNAPAPGGGGRGHTSAIGCWK
jgi:hypothetical protein